MAIVKEEDADERDLTQKEKGQEETDSSQPGQVTVSKEEYEALLAHVKELEELKDKLMRSAADFENAKKRLAREREEFVKFGQEAFIRRLLPVLDNFERAISHAGIASDDEADAGKYRGLLTGIQMVYKQIQDILKSQGLVRIETRGHTFDPHKHEAVAHIPGEGKEDEVVEEIEAGYMLHDRLLRAAKVNIRSSPASSG